MQQATSQLLGGQATSQLLGGIVAAGMAGGMAGGVGGGGGADSSSVLLQAGLQGMASGLSRTAAGDSVKSYTGSTLAVLRYYFQVDTNYVLEKLSILAVPYRHKEWGRTMMLTVDEGPPVMQPPKMDVNAPDLYVPLMAFLTYILLVGFVAGASGRFTPEMLGSTPASPPTRLSLHPPLPPPPLPAGIRTLLPPQASLPPRPPALLPSRSLTPESDG